MMGVTGCNEDLNSWTVPIGSPAVCTVPFAWPSERLPLGRSITEGNMLKPGGEACCGGV